MSLKDALAGIKEAQTPETLEPITTKSNAAKKLVAKPALSSTRATGKSSNPEYEPVKLYIRKRTRKDASRKWEDAGGGDFSELVQNLLGKYLST